MKKALIIGASGLVGSYLLDILLQDSLYSNVVSLVRKKSNVNHPKLDEYSCDFSKLSDNSHYFIDIDELYICIGTTQKKTPDKKEYFNIDYGIPTQAAKIALEAGVQKIAVISAMGANAKSSVFYNATKGKMEDYLMSLNIPQLIIVRPSLIVGNRKEKRFGETIATFVMNTVSFLLPIKYKAIHAEQIAFAMQTLLQGTSTQTIWENDALHRINSKK